MTLVLRDANGRLKRIRLPAGMILKWKKNSNWFIVSLTGELL